MNAKLIPQLGKVIDFEMPNKGQALCVLVLSDLHSEYINLSALHSTLKYFSTIPKKRRRIWLMGDILDMEFLVSKKESFKRAKKSRDFDGYFVPQIEKEYDWFDWFYNEIIKYVDNSSCITFFEGNHEQRARRENFTSFMLHDYAHWFDVPKRLKLEERNITYIPYNDWLRINTIGGRLLATHGIYCGANPIKKHIDVAKNSVIFGHTHERGVASFRSVETTHMGFNNPCLCNTEMIYMEGKPTNWSVGFSIIPFDHNNFWVNQFTIHDGVLRDPQGRKY